MKGKMDTRTQHENEPSQSHLEIFWHAKDFATAHEVPAWPWETPHVVKRWLKMPSWMTRCVYDQSRLWTFPFSCIHLVSTSGQCDACIMLASHCPEIDTRWSYEYGILNFVRRWSLSHTWSRSKWCLQKVSGWYPNYAHRQHEDVKFCSVV